MILIGNILQMSQLVVFYVKVYFYVLYVFVGVYFYFIIKEWNEKIVREIEELVKDSVVVVIGEVGLDFYRNYLDEKV